MKKYQVFDNGRRAQYPDCAVSKSWDKSCFNSFEKAESYALKWLGGYSPGVGVLKLNCPFNYSGYEDMIEIREI